MKRATEQLICAVQSHNLQTFKQVLNRLKAACPTEGDLACALNTPLPQLDVTALHVAVRSYAVHPNKRDVLNQMVALLLEAGAECTMCQRTTTVSTIPWSIGGRFIGHKKVSVQNSGVSVFELCQGNTPPALQTYVQSRPVRDLDGFRFPNRADWDDEDVSADQAYLACLRKEVA